MEMYRTGWSWVSAAQANCVVEIVPPKSGHNSLGPSSAVTAEVRWAGDKQAAAHTVQRAWEHVRSHVKAGSASAARSSVDDVHFQEALLASSPLFVSIRAPEVLADISRVRLPRECLSSGKHEDTMRST